MRNSLLLDSVRLQRLLAASMRDYHPSYTRDHNQQSCMPANEGLAYISLHPTGGKIPPGLASGFVFSQPAISPRTGVFTFLSHDSRVNGQWSQGIRSELVLRVADDVASLDAQLARSCKGVHQLANEFDLCNGRKALTSCQKQLQLVAISDDISVTLGSQSASVQTRPIFNYMGGNIRLGRNGAGEFIGVLQTCL